MKRSSRWLTLATVALLSLSVVAARPQSTTLRGTVFNDANRNGKLDQGEAPLVDIRVQVSTPDLSFVQEYRSGDDGTFGPALSQGTFTVRILPPDGWSVTTAKEYTVFVEQGKTVTGLDFGLVQGAAGAARPASGAAGGSSSPGTLPTTGGERAADPGGEPGTLIGLWLAICGAAFLILVAFNPRAQRK